MSALPAAASALVSHLEEARFPLYLVGHMGHEQRILFANRALQEWADLTADQIVGRRVEYHAASMEETAGPLTGLCPSPDSMAGTDGEGTVSVTGRDGRLRHRRARFLTLPPVKVDHGDAHSVFVWVMDVDLTAEELLTQVSNPTTHDQRQLAVRQFYKDYGASHEMAALLGTVIATRQMRRQAEAAAKSGANAIVMGPSATDAELVARAIHRLSSVGSESLRLEPLHMESLSPEQVEHRVHRAATVEGSTVEGSKVTLLLLGLEKTSKEAQAWLANCLEKATQEPRCLAAMAIDHSTTDKQRLPKLAESLQAKLGILTLWVPSLADRTTDLPLLAQLFVQRLNAAEVRIKRPDSAAAKQLGGLTPAALDRLALYSWPGGVAQLQEVIAEAHQQAVGPFIDVDDLPTLIRHASQAAEYPAEQSIKIDLDQYLQAIERELVQRAMATVDDNKAEAARLLGITRQRLYRTLQRVDENASQVVETKSKATKLKPPTTKNETNSKAKETYKHTETNIEENLDEIEPLFNEADE